MDATPSLLKETGYISRPSCVSIGPDVTVQGGYYWNIVEQDSVNLPQLTIGYGSQIEAGSHVQCGHKVHIGRNVKIGPYVSLSDHAAHSKHPGYPTWAKPEKDPRPAGELMIRDGSIIGAHSVITGPIMIGIFCIVEPHSVVVDNVPSFCRVSGNPAIVTEVFVPELLDWVKVSSEEERESALASRHGHPLLSIVMPTFNRARHLNNNLHSIYTQICDGDLVEVVISDNASSDQTQLVSAAYTRLFSSARYSRNAENIGADRNIALVSTLAKGSFIKLQGDDDYWIDGALPDFLGIIMNHLDCALIHTNQFKSDGQVYCLEGGDNFLALTGNNAVSMTMNTMKRSVWEQIGDKLKFGYTNLNHFYWFYEILIRNPKFCIINRNLHRGAGIAPMGYNVGEVGIKNYLEAIQHYEGSLLSSEAIHMAKKRHLYKVLLRVYEIIVKYNLPSDVSNFEDYYTDSYANEDYYEDGLMKLRQISALRP
ncbi:glycosyltransferase [Paenibacillus sp. FSL R7-0179]|uniref:glycosyltransferase n=1 Tax=Paenibacillus sp. FSL R7-0179 TaxID=2921672 RepID=UPI0030F9774D